MKIKFVFFVVLLIGWLPASSYADNLVATIIQSADDAEEDITGPMAGDVRRTSSDLEIGNENGVEQWAGVRFQDLALPPGSTITSATIKFTGSETDVGTLIIPIVGELSPDADEFGDLTPLTTRPLTTASVDWNIDPWFPGDSGANTTTPNLAAIVQEIVDQPGWASGNSLVILLQNQPGDTSERLAVSFDGNPLAAAELTIEFTPFICPSGGILIEGTGEIGDFSSACGSDDFYWAAHGTSLFYQIADPVVQFELTAAAPAGFGGNTLSVDIEASKQNDNATLILRANLFNFTTGSYVALPGIFALSTVDQVKSFALPAGSAPADFIEPSTSEVRLLLQTIQSTGLPNVRTQLDEVLFNFE